MTTETYYYHEFIDGNNISYHYIRYVNDSCLDNYTIRTILICDPKYRIEINPNSVELVYNVNNLYITRIDDIINKYMSYIGNINDIIHKIKNIIFIYINVCPYIDNNFLHYNITLDMYDYAFLSHIRNIELII